MIFTDENRLDILSAIDHTIVDLEELNAKDSPWRQRELSLAITRIREGKHWLIDAWGPLPD